MATTIIDRADLLTRLPPRRVVLLGASNVTRGISSIVAAACRLWGGPLDVLAAFGHGRSYGERKAVLWRELPGIVECGLWEALDRRPPAPTAALITDVGNDLLYDVPVPQIVAWVETCVERLQRFGARIVLTPLPLRGIRGLARTKFVILRSVLFPGCRLTHAMVLQRAAELDRGLRTLAHDHGVRLVEHQAGWYGFDPIHIRWWRRPAAWHEMLSAWEYSSQPPAEGPSSLRRYAYLRRVPPAQRWLFGREQRKAQPAGVLPDGTTLAFY